MTEPAQSHENTLAMNEALMLGSVRQHELTEAAESSNAQLQEEITARKQSEEALRQVEGRLRFVMESMPQKIFTAKPNGDVDYFNPQWTEFTGLSFEQIRDWGWTQFIYPGDVEENIRVWQHSIDTGEPFQFEHRFRRADGEYRWHISLATPKRDAEGRIVMWIGSDTDIHKQKQAEEEIRRLNEDLEQHVLERTADLTAANQDLEAFSYSVAHDLRAPLRHIDGFASLLAKHLDPSLDATGRRYLAKVSGSARQMGELIDALLNFSRIGRAELRVTRLDLSGLVQEVLRLLEPETADRDIEWVMNELPEAQGDPQLLRLVFQNLLGNALKYTRPKPRARIEIGVTREGAGLIFSIRDNGVGFDMRYVDWLFGVFQRLHSGAEFEGTGIGLANVKRIVQRHGGRVWAEGAVGEGACFYFSLPDLA